MVALLRKMNNIKDDNWGYAHDLRNHHMLYMVQGYLRQVEAEPGSRLMAAAGSNLGNSNCVVVPHEATDG